MTNIYFDYSTMMTWEGSHTGIPRVVESLARAMAIIGDVQFVAISDELAAFHRVNIDTQEWLEPIEFIAGDVLFSGSANWAYECYNSVLSELVADGVMFACLFYDLIPWKFPYFYKDGKEFGEYFGNWTQETLGLATEKFSISQSVADDLCSLTGNDENVQVIRLGDEMLSSEQVVAPSDSSLQDLGGFILTVGTIEIRKNHQMLLAAYRLLAERGVEGLPTILIVGRDGWLNNHLDFQLGADPCLQGKIRIINKVSDRDLNYLYQNCSFTVFPSLYEGWGLPIAESLKYGKQCISSNTSSMIEIAPDLIRFAHPLKVDEWADQIQLLAFDPELLKSESDRIAGEYLGSTWVECAESILSSLRGK